MLSIDDLSAFNEIHNRYFEKLFVTAHFRMNDPLEAEELVQDVLFKLWQKRRTLVLNYTLNTYLAAALKYEVINRLSRERKRRKVEGAQLTIDPITETNTEQTLDFADLQDRLAQLVKQLPDKCRLVFTLSRDGGLSQKQISQRLNISENTVESHIKHALKSLRTGLQNFFSIFF
jgi:RNA polymerase sigma-70 factor (ECF subfamily)